MSDTSLLAKWFLTVAERGNDFTSIDQRHDNGMAWTSGNTVVVHVDGAGYYRRLAELFAGLSAGDHVWFTDWEGDADERLTDQGPTVAEAFESLERRGVDVCGLLWRSHPTQAGFAAQDNSELAGDVNEDNGQIELDERVRRGGSHHQKTVIIHREGGADVAFVGGIDLCHGRRDDADHLGDPQAYAMDECYGPTPAWHDAQLELTGPAVDDVSWSFRERWDDPNSLDGRSIVRALRRRVAGQARKLPPLPRQDPRSSGDGPHHVQVLRTYPFRRPPYGFAPEGERSVARGYLKALARARRLVAIEDQYLWSGVAADALADALRAHPDLLVVVFVPRYPDEAGGLSGAANRGARNQAIATLTQAGGERVAVYDLENREGSPIYVHAKVCILDDVWLEVGSDNVNRRSWTHDSEMACAVIDERRDPRAPTDPGGLGDGARVLARDTRLTLWREHLGRQPGDDGDLVDPQEGFDALREGAEALDIWVRAGRLGRRPPGQLRPHEGRPVPGWMRPLASVAYHLVVDPDGRSLAQRRSHAY
ncbi:MAG: phospholipase D family protein [Acidimicrobiales bacterium]